MGILIGVLSVAVFVDMRRYKIPNLCIVVGMIAGLIMTYASYSFAGVGEALAQAGLVFLVLYPFYLMRGIGAGDVKLFIMTACFLQGKRLLDYLLISMLIAGAVSIFKMICFTESRQRLLYLGRYLRKVALTGSVDAYNVGTLQPRSVIRLSVPALAGAVLLFLGVY